METGNNNNNNINNNNNNKNIIKKYKYDEILSKIFYANTTKESPLTSIMIGKLNRI